MGTEEHAEQKVTPLAWYDQNPFAHPKERMLRYWHLKTWDCAMED